MANNLALTGAQFSGGGLTAGWGQAPADVLGTTGNSWAWECKFTSAAANGATQVLMASAEGTTGVGFVGIDSSGRLLGNIASGNVTITGAVVTDNVEHTVAMSAGPSGFILLLDGAVQGQSSSTQSVPANVPFTVRGFNSTTRNYDFAGKIREVAVWTTNKYPAAYTPSSSALTGSETGLAALWHLSADGADSAGSGEASGLIAPNDPNIVYSPGVWDVTASRAKTINAGAYFRTLIQGSPTALALSFDISVDTAPLPQIMARVDHGPWLIQEVAASVPLTLPNSAQTTNTWNSHIIELIVKSTSETQSRWSPQSTSVSFLGVVISPSTCATTPIYQSPRKLLVFGDSITEGVRTLQQTATSSKDTDRNDASVGWAFSLTRELGAEVGVIGFGASGFTGSGSGGVPAFGGSYPVLWGSGPARSLAGYDGIIINHGGNDGYGASPASVTAAAIPVLNGILAASGTTQIFFMGPLTGAQYPALQAAIAASNNPARITWIDPTGWHNRSLDTSDGIHPLGYIDITSVAPRLAAIINAKLTSPGFFPQFRSGFH